MSGDMSIVHDLIPLIAGVLLFGLPILALFAYAIGASAIAGSLMEWWFLDCLVIVIIILFLTPNDGGL